MERVWGKGFGGEWARVGIGSESSEVFGCWVVGSGSARK